MNARNKPEPTAIANLREGDGVRPTRAMVSTRTVNSTPYQTTAWPAAAEHKAQNEGEGHVAFSEPEARARGKSQRPRDEATAAATHVAKNTGVRCPVPSVPLSRVDEDD